MIRSCWWCCYLLLLLKLAFHCQEAMAFPRNKSITPTAKFSRKRVILNNNNNNNNNIGQQSVDGTACPSLPRTPVISPSVLVKIDFLIGLVCSVGLFVVPEYALSLFVDNHDLMASHDAFLKMMVRMVAILQMGYITGLLYSPPEISIRVTAVILSMGGAMFVYYSQTKFALLSFWSFILLTSGMVVAHLLAL